MTLLPAPVQDLMEELTRLPGIGRRSAERILTHLLIVPPERATALGDAIARLRERVQPCRRCGFWAEGALCAVCADERRDPGFLCVVETPADLYAFEQAGAFRGRYHVLGGLLAPLKGIGPEDLRLEAVVARVADEDIREIIIATPPTVEGDATALYLAQALAGSRTQVTRIGVGLPLGAALGYADPGTLKLALEGRRRLGGGSATHPAEA